jgi:multimeric flavodoxin WrbA
MSKQLLILEGSPRRRGNSATLAHQAASGARETGAQVESIYLQGLKIAHCSACDNCRKTGLCSINDDMQTLYPKLSSADALLLASPIYWFTYSSQLKTCIDRMYALWNGNHNVFKGKPIGFILTYGDTDEYTSGAINAIKTFESMFNFLEAKIVEIVHGSLMDPDDAQNNPELLQRSFNLGKKLFQDVIE